jgi:hypothetical protein
MSIVILPSRYCGLKTSLLMSSIVTFMMTNQCSYYTHIGFPPIPVAALAVEKVGHSSVHYQLALCRPKTVTKVKVDHLTSAMAFSLAIPSWHSLRLWPAPQDIQSLLKLMGPASAGIMSIELLMS